MLCFLSTVRVENRSFQSNQNPVNCQELTFLPCQPSTIALTTALRATLKKYYQLILQHLISVLISFAVSYTESVENTWIKPLQNLSCQIEDPLLWKLLTDPCKIPRMTKLCYKALVNSPAIIRHFL